MAGKIESIIFDRTKQQLFINKTTVFCFKESRIYPMRDIIDVKAYKKGHSGVNTYTLYYKIMIMFKNDHPLKLTETAVEEKCIK